MSPERWQHINEIYLVARNLAPDSCAVYLEAVCGDDPDLRAAVMALVEAERPKDEEGGDLHRDAEVHLASSIQIIDALDLMDFSQSSDAEAKPVNGHFDAKIEASNKPKAVRRIKGLLKRRSRTPSGAG
jgi:hypothetical protein